MLEYHNKEHYWQYTCKTQSSTNSPLVNQIYFSWLILEYAVKLNVLKLTSKLHPIGNSNSRLLFP